MKDDIMDIPIDQIVVADWDSRSKPEDHAGIIALSQSIKTDGFVNALTCVKDGEKYILLAGRHRLKAAKILGLTTVPVYVKPGILTEGERRRITMIENAHRQEIDEIERGQSIAGVYEGDGFSAEQALHAAKAIDNFCFNRGTDLEELSQSTAKFRSVEEERRSEHGGQNWNPLIFDPKFLATCEAIGYTPKYQWQLLRWVVDIEPSVLKKAEKIGLEGDKKTMLTTGSLNDHPKLQKELIDQIKDLSPASARKVVQQTASDLQTGYIEKTKGGTYVVNNGKERITKKDKVLDPVNARVVDIFAAIDKILFRLTGHKLSRGQHEYKKENIDYTEDYRIETIKVLGERELVTLEEQLKLVDKVTKQTLHIISEEFKARDLKKGLISK